VNVEKSGRVWMSVLLLASVPERQARGAYNYQFWCLLMGFVVFFFMSVYVCMYFSLADYNWEMLAIQRREEEV